MSDRVTKRGYLQLGLANKDRNLGIGHLVIPKALLLEDQEQLFVSQLDRFRLQKESCVITLSYNDGYKDPPVNTYFKLMLRYGKLTAVSFSSRPCTCINFVLRSSKLFSSMSIRPIRVFN